MKKNTETSKASETAKEVVSALNRAIDRSHKDFEEQVEHLHKVTLGVHREKGKK